MPVKVISQTMISWTYLSLGLSEETVTCLSLPKKRALLCGSPFIMNQTSHVLLTMLPNMGEMDLGESVPSARAAPAFLTNYNTTRRRESSCRVS